MRYTLKGRTINKRKGHKHLRTEAEKMDYLRKIGDKMVELNLKQRELFRQGKNDEGWKVADAIWFAKKEHFRVSQLLKAQRARARKKDH